MFHPLKVHSNVRELYRASRHYGSSFTFTLGRAVRLHNHSLFSLADMNGVGIDMIRKSGERFLIADRWSGANEFYEHLVRRSVNGRLLLQKRLYNHPALCSLSGKTALQTVRIVTFVQEDGTCAFMFARLKLIVGDNQTDNFRHGITGNVVAVVDLENGRLSAVFGKVLGEVGVRRLSHHPDSGNPLEGFLIPDWPELLSLIRRAAAAFARLRVLAWDVAVTPRGPVLLEGNQEWGLLSLAPIRRPVSNEQWQKLLRPIKSVRVIKSRDTRGAEA